MDLTLDRVQRLCALLPAYTRPTIHIAGTNGKGSVTALISSILTSSEISVGRFNSPHLIDPRDSIFLNGQSISQEVYNTARTNVECVDHEHRINATSFEISTATAMQILEEAQVDVAVFEVGLGGKHDATNVLPDHAILISAITSIDLDHQLLLGTTPTEIARVKAGIARSGKVCVLAVQKHPEVESAVREVVNFAGGELINAMDVKSGVHSPDGFQKVFAPFEAWNTTLDLDLPLLGAHQLLNLSTALTILSVLIKQSNCSVSTVLLEHITPRTLYTGVLQTTWAGRLSHVRLLSPSLTLLVDGAHNPAAAVALQDYLACSTQPLRSRTFILGLSHSPPKTPRDTLTPLLHPGDRVALVHFSDVQDMPWVKNVSFPEMESVVRELVGEEGEIRAFKLNPDQRKGPLDPLNCALHWAAKSGNETVVLAGSLYLVADLYRIAREQGTF